jgi:hypothetical protein
VPRKTYRYVLNLRTRVMHVLPTMEQCNMDQAKRTKRFKSLRDATDGRGYYHCVRCFWANRRG